MLLFAKIETISSKCVIKKHDLFLFLSFYHRVWHFLRNRQNQNSIQYLSNFLKLYVVAINSVYTHRLGTINLYD